jgi:hypothetical protein
MRIKPYKLDGLDSRLHCLFFAIYSLFTIMGVFTVLM